MSWRSATRLVARWTAPIWVRSPNLSTVAMRLTTTAANSSYGLCSSGLPMSPMKNPMLSVAASSTKKPKTTFSRFTRLSRRRPPGPHDLGGRVAGALAEQQKPFKGNLVGDWSACAREGARPPARCPCVNSPREVDVVVIGAGQAGLSAAWSLARQGFTPEAGFVVLDGEQRPGGAWQHRWPSLTVGTTHRVHELPGLPFEPDADEVRAAEAVPAYFADYERRFGLPVHRPVRVTAVSRSDDGRFLVRTDSGDWTARALVNASGTWTRPFIPHYPGQETFTGRQLHPVDYRSAEEFTGRHVVVVGGGASAVQLLGEISAVTSTTWVTRRPPVWRAGPFGPEEGRAAVAPVEEAVREGRSPAASSASPVCWSPRPTSGTLSTAVRCGGCRCSTASPRTASRGTPAASCAPTSSSGPPGSGRRWATWPRCICAGPPVASAWRARTSPVSRCCTWSATDPRPARSAPPARARPPPVSCAAFSARRRASPPDPPGFPRGDQIAAAAENADLRDRAGDPRGTVVR